MSSIVTAPPSAPLGDTRARRRAADDVRRHELGGFLRSRRERIAPEQVGLPRGRRRTPGLRREEVAQLSGVGVTWYTWLEQGRDISVSDQVLEAVSRTLQLDPHERSHLFTLAGAGARTVDREADTIPSALHTVLGRLNPLPASVMNARYEILAYNPAYRWLIDDLDAVPQEDRNLLWLIFTHPSWREALVDWEDTTVRLVGQYRAAMAEHVAEPAWKCLSARLRAESPVFAALWERHEVTPMENKIKRFVNPRVGLLRLDHTALWFGPGFGSRLVTYTPADEETAVRLTALYEAMTNETALN